MSGLSGWAKIGNDDVRIGNRASAFTAANLHASANALYEAIQGSPPPGTQKLFFHPHDHGKHGGVPIPRGAHWNFEAGGNADAWKISCPTADEEFWVDRTGVVRVITDPGGGEANIVMDVPWGMDSTKNNLSDNPCTFEAKVWAWVIPATGSPEMRIKFYNRTTQSSSDVQTITSGSFGSAQKLTFEEIPIKGGIRNELLVIAESVTNPSAARILGINISSTRQSSQPKSGGANDLLSHPKV